MIWCTWNGWGCNLSGGLRYVHFDSRRQVNCCGRLNFSGNNEIFLNNENVLRHLSGHAGGWTVFYDFHSLSINKVSCSIKIIDNVYTHTHTLHSIVTPSLYLQIQCSPKRSRQPPPPPQKKMGVTSVKIEL